ncbi:hypothetical protein ACFL0X_01375 [Nanoarchaeota archaeon]
MRKRIRKIVGIVLGIGLMFASLSGMTGYVVFEDSKFGVSSIVGLILVIGGVVLFVGGLDYRIDSHEKRRIANAFKGGWKNAPDKQQRRILT